MTDKPEPADAVRLIVHLKVRLTHLRQSIGNRMTNILSGSQEGSCTGLRVKDGVMDKWRERHGRRLDWLNALCAPQR